MASKRKATTSWYSHPVYARYWQHYHHAVIWMRSYQKAYKKAIDFYFNSPWFSPYGFFPWSSLTYEAGYPWFYPGRYTAWQWSPCNVSYRKSRGHRRHNRNRTKSRRGNKALCKVRELESDSDNEVEYDLSNMVITEELRQYFAVTERHREERRKQQQREAERLDDYVYADHGLYYNHHRSVEPPSERPGERRLAEMKQLYGKSTSKIMAMEAAVQLSFNKFCDRKQPRYWPVIPLKF
ncbi:gem-associated protein 8-like [Meriones unguiculatus]|uniref:gem-associated protein 8-like n=1 Tax=Meriones unguiculatus TaxID=10047 RepID=UPI00293F339C|nr:gem-associated protein 8-like [Meriones unguiculatus]